MVSLMAGPSRRCMSSFIRLRGTSVRYHWAWDRPRSTARWPPARPASSRVGAVTATMIRPGRTRSRCSWDGRAQYGPRTPSGRTSRCTQHRTSGGHVVERLAHPTLATATGDLVGDWSWTVWLLIPPALVLALITATLSGALG